MACGCMRHEFVFFVCYCQGRAWDDAPVACFKFANSLSDRQHNINAQPTSPITLFTCLCPREESQPRNTEENPPFLHIYICICICIGVFQSLTGNVILDATK